MDYTTKIKVFTVATSLAFSAYVSSVCATSSYSTIAVPQETSSYKDSFYFVDNGTKYLAVSDLTLGGISLLKSYGGSDTDYRFEKHVTGRPLVTGTNYWAPTLIATGIPGEFIFVTTHFVSNPLSDSYLEYFTYNVRTDTITAGVQPVTFQNYNGKGMIDATIWVESSQNNTVYLIGSRWEVGVTGSRLQWSKLTAQSGYVFTAPVDLYNTPNVSGTQYRVDWNRGATIDWVVEAPIWSYWDHNNDGHHELYWSVGHSSPCETSVSAIRRGDINWSGTTPWIYVFNDDMTSSNMTPSPCLRSFLTHPDFTTTGQIRATSYYGSKFVIVNQNIW